MKIVKHHTLYGTGDCEDTPEIAEDQVVECFYVFYQTPAGRPKWTRGGGAPTLAEAIAMTEAAVKVRWDGETCESCVGGLEAQVDASAQVL